MCVFFSFCFSVKAKVIVYHLHPPFFSLYLSHTLKRHSCMIHDVKRDVTAIQLLLPLYCKSCPNGPSCSFAEGSGHLVGPCQQCQLLSLSAKHSWLLLMAAKRASATSHFTGLLSSLRTGVLWIKQICQEFKLLTAICCPYQVLKGQKYALSVCLCPRLSHYDLTCLI